MKRIIKDISIEVTTDGDIVIGKDGEKFMTLKIDGTLELQLESAVWGAAKISKVALQGTGGSYGGGTFEQYMSGNKIVFASKNSDQESRWVYFDFDDPSSGWQTSTTEPA